MEILAAQIATLVAFFFTMLVSCLLPLKLLPSRETLFSSPAFDLGFTLANCLSAGVFLATFFVGLLPEVRRQFTVVLNERRIITSFPVTEFVVFLGFFFAIAVEQLLIACKRRVDASTAQPSEQCPKDEHVQQERDHHHHHHHHHQHSHDIGAALSASDSKIRIALLLLSLGVHSLFEGITLGLQTHFHALINLFVGVLIHECLVAFAVGVIVAKLKLKFRVTLQLAVLFSASIPVGQVVGLLIGISESSTNAAVSVVLQALAAGTFIHVTFLEIIPEGLAEEKMKSLQILFLVLGFGLIALVPAFIGLHDDTFAAVNKEYRLLLEMKRNLTL